MKYIFFLPGNFVALYEGELDILQMLTQILQVAEPLSVTAHSYGSLEVVHCYYFL